MNDLQITELNLLKCFLDICDTLEIKYFLVCGSALGAVKYGGFIPWDDDLDVGMYRRDSERFLENAPPMLPDNVFLQSYESDNAYPQIFAKLRNSDTTYIEKTVAKLDMNHGVYIDIFPLDGYPRLRIKQSMLEFRKKIYKRLISCNFDADRGFLGKLYVSVFRFFKIHKYTNSILKKYEKMISKYCIEDSDLICNHGNWQGRLEYASREQYGDGAWAEFEGLKVRVPERYDEYLTQKYGDWRADLPEDQQVGHHYYEVCDLSKPYTEYLR